jgi:purine nucleosidase
VGREDIPFFRGCENFILQDWKPSIYKGFGENGFGDIDIKTNLKPCDESAVDALIRLSKMHNDIHLIAIGPLTNIALACLIDSDFPKRVKKITVMGGAHQCKGNTGFASEFNIHCDPEAGHICLNKFEIINMVTWETCFKCALSWDFFSKLENLDNSVSRFLVAISQKYISIFGKSKPGLIVCDLIATLSLLCEDKKKSMDMFGHVELSGDHTRGATIFKWIRFDKEKRVNVRILKIDMNKIYDYCKLVFNLN